MFIEQIDATLTQEAFAEIYIQAKKPVIIKGGAAHWPAITSWSPTTIANKLPQRKFPVTIFGKDKLPNKAFILLQPEAIARTICEQLSEKRKYYLAQNINPTDFPQLFADLDYPKWIDSEAIYEMNLWFSQQGNETILHFDPPQNFLVQVFGYKDVYLFPPEATSYLYPFAFGNKTSPRLSQILDFKNPNLTRYPDFTLASLQKGRLAPGDMLFIPAGWWHGVDSVTVSLSVNFWWKTKPNECNLRQILGKFLVEFYKTNKFNRIRQCFLDLSAYPTDLSFAQSLLTDGYLSFAALFAAHTIDQHFQTIMQQYNLFSFTRAIHDLSSSKLWQACNQALAVHFPAIAVPVNTLASWQQLLQLALQEDDNLLNYSAVESLLNTVAKWQHSCRQIELTHEQHQQRFRQQIINNLRATSYNRIAWDRSLFKPRKPASTEIQALYDEAKLLHSYLNKLTY